MPSFVHRGEIEDSADAVYAWHTRPGAFERLAPPWRSTRLLDRGAGLAEGARTVLEVRVGPLRRRWVAVHRDVTPGRGFTDVQEEGPFRRWRHEHRFVPIGPARCAVEDHVAYELPFGGLGSLAAGRSVRRELERLFAHRHRRLQADLARHRGAAGLPPLRVVISGASGMIGTALSAFLESGGHRVDRLRRRPDDGGIRWDPARGKLDPAALEGADAVVHLAGESIAGGRWTPARKRAILESRVAGTRLLAGALAGMRTPPRVLISASAVGVYGDRRGEEVDESSAPGTGFLAEVARAWEAETAAAERAGIRVVRLRIGVVLSAQGGVLGRMRLPFALGLGGPVGRGDTPVSWIALDDLVGIVHALLGREDVGGPVNAVAPEPATNRDLTAALARALHRPAVLPLPEPAVRAVLGEMGQELLLSGARVRPRRLSEMGFRWLQPDLYGAVAAELGAA